MPVQYLEIVSPDGEQLVGLYHRVHGLEFGSPDPDLGHARVATCADGSLVGIRARLAAHEQPIVRVYQAVDVWACTGFRACVLCISATMP